VANGVVVYSELVGEILLRPLLVHGRIGRPIYLTNVLYVPLLSHNFISTTYLSRVHQYSILMNKHTILFKQNGVLLFEADIDERNQAFVREVASPSSDSALAVGTLPLD
ncbi:hypothetical protein B0H17DRAFT_1238531, partial [Mycena rosella]